MAGKNGDVNAREEKDDYEDKARECEMLEVTVGVHQGSVLSPLLFVADVESQRIVAMGTVVCRWLGISS